MFTAYDWMKPARKQNNFQGLKGLKFIDIKSVFFKTILQKGTGTTCKERLQFSPLTYRSSLLTVQCCDVKSAMFLETLSGREPDFQIY